MHLASLCCFRDDCGMLRLAPLRDHLPAIAINCGIGFVGFAASVAVARIQRANIAVGKLAGAWFGIIVVGIALALVM